MNIGNYDDLPEVVLESEGKSTILSNRVYCSKYNGFVTQSVLDLINNGKNDIDLSKVMDLCYICDGVQVDVSLEYLGNFEFRLITISDSSKELPNLELRGFDLYDDVAQFLLKNMGYVDISEKPSVIIDQPTDTSKIIGAH